jgi:GntR family transcriptional regulator, histidine utilization repressor
VLPQYQKIKQYVCEFVESGQWLAGHRIPSDNMFAEQFSVSRMTANRALRELTDEGILTRIVGVGTFVAESIPQTPLFEIKNIADEIRSRGHRYSAQLQWLERKIATKEAAVELEVATDSTIFHSLVVHCENETPVQLEERYVNPSLAPHYMEQDFSQITPNEYLVKVAPLTEAEHVIEAVLPDATTQRLLSIEATQPCLLIHRRTWSGNALASSARLIHPSSRYRMGGRFVPDRKPMSLGKVTRKS